MARVDIVRENGSVAFRPAVTSVEFEDAVFWRNLDPDDEHWITKCGEADNFLFPSPLARFTNGTPADVTGEVLIDGALTYCCALHPGEQGTIVLK